MFPEALSTSESIDPSMVARNLYYPDDKMPTCDKRIDSKRYGGDQRSRFTTSKTIGVWFNGLDTWVETYCGKPAMRAYSGADHVDPGGSRTWKSTRCDDHPEFEYTGSTEGGYYAVADGCTFDGTIKPLSQKPSRPPSFLQRIRARFA